MLEKFKFLMKKEKKRFLHVAITTHGMRLWFEDNKKSLNESYKRGFDIITDIISCQSENNIPILTFYLVPEFLIEKEHFPLFLDEFVPFLNALKNSDVINHNKIKVSALGKWYDLPGRAVDSIKSILDHTKFYDDYFLNFCINYSGQEEIVDACKLIARKIKADKLEVDAINTQLIKDNIYSSYFLPPDLIIKNGLNECSSGLLLWDSPKSKIHFTKKLFPDFSKSEFLKIL